MSVDGVWGWVAGLDDGVLVQLMGLGATDGVLGQLTGPSGWLMGPAEG